VRRSTSEHTVDTRAVEDLAGFAGWAGAVALDLGARRQEYESAGGRATTYLSLAAALAVHGLSGFVGDAAGRKTVDSNLWSRHCCCH
jgi:hypothetical protein